MANISAPFSNRDKDVFLIKLGKQLDRGALISRYSRASALDIREVYDKEFEPNPNRGREFYRRVFSEYGDESVSELMTAQVGMQNISNIAAKYVEDLRIGLSFIEKSSRYVRYDKKRDDRFLFLEAEKVGLSGELAKKYTDLCNDLFTFYSENYEPMKKVISDQFPIEKCVFSARNSDRELGLDDLPPEDALIAKKAYESAVRSRALDDLRYILPASTLTNLGVSGNARSFAYMILRMYASGAPELNELARALEDELITEFPEVVKSGASDRGKHTVDYISRRNSFGGDPTGVVPAKTGVVLMGFVPEAKELEKMLFAYRIRTGTELKTSKATSSAFADTFSALRSSKRDKPPREFEIPRYDFEITTNFGAFRDLHRHRMMSMVRGYLTPELGFDYPEFIKPGSGAGGRFLELMRKSANLWKEVADIHGRKLAQYCLPFAYRYPVFVSMNLREATHFCELRSTPQAHPDLRRIAMDIASSISEVHPGLSRILKFVDTGSYPLGRIFAEFGKEKKLL